MSPNDLKEQLINKLQATNDVALLEELSVLFELNEPDTVYKLNDDQKEKVRIAREQIKSNQFLTDDEAENDIDKWLNK